MHRDHNIRKSLDVVQMKFLFMIPASLSITENLYRHKRIPSFNSTELRVALICLDNAPQFVRNFIQPPR